MENPLQVDVYFDDLTVEHVKGPIVQETDYYPFGLTYNGVNRENSLVNKYKFNGIEELSDLDLDLLQTNFRLYDPALARFGAIDPLTALAPWRSPYLFSANNPISYADPLGLIEEESRGADGLTNEEWMAGSRPGGPNSFDMMRTQADQERRQYANQASPNISVDGKRLNPNTKDIDDELFRFIRGNTAHVYYASYFWSAGAQQGRTEQEIKDFYVKNFGWSQGLNNIEIGAPPNFFVNERGLISDGVKSVLARTIPGKNNTSTIYVSPYLSRAAKIWLFGILGHETVHVYDNFKHGYDASGASEYNAWSWSLEWAKAIRDADMQKDADEKLELLKGSRDPIFNYKEYGLPTSPKD